MQGEDLEALFLDLHFALVDRLFVLQQRAGSVGPQLGQRLTGAEDHLFDHRRLSEQILLEGFQITIQDAST